jgi:hypothetical protein
MVSKQPYGDIKYPKDPGSGGGFILPQSIQSSSGGGLINIQVFHLRINNSRILSEGKNGRQGGAGGSGGSISIDYSNITILTSALISANGGNGDKQKSSGAGGRIRFIDQLANSSR